MPVLRSGRARQRGWVGLVIILVALVIVAVLAQTALKSYGLLPATQAARALRGPPPVSPASDPTSVPATPTAAIERARGLEQQMQRDAQEQAKRIDDSTH
jgi:cytochrome c-type biogenesis protein CcmH/NrfG